MTDYNLKLSKVTMVFGRRMIFNSIEYNFESGQIYGLAGSNGSGKSTLSKIIAGIISPTHGKIIHQINGKEIIPEKLHNHLGFVSPYLVLYDEFSAEENLKFFAKIRGVNYDKDFNENLLNEFNLLERKRDLLKGYSSGMKQRMKFIFALQHNPSLLILDEPTSNLDNKGKEKVYEIIRQKAEKCCIIIASNEDSDLALCNKVLDVEKYK